MVSLYGPNTSYFIKVLTQGHQTSSNLQPVAITHLQPWQDLMRRNAYFRNNPRIWGTQTCTLDLTDWRVRGEGPSLKCVCTGEDLWLSQWYGGRKKGWVKIYSCALLSLLGNRKVTSAWPACTQLPRLPHTSHQHQHFLLCILEEQLGRKSWFTFLLNSSGPSLRRLLLVLDAACPLPNTYWNQVSITNCWETEPFWSVGRSGFTFIEGECPCSHAITFRLESKVAAPFTPSSPSVFCQEQHKSLTESSGILDFTDSRTRVHNKPFF